jgi:hypothetical protein
MTIWNREEMVTLAIINNSPNNQVSDVAMPGKFFSIQT